MNICKKNLLSLTALLALATLSASCSPESIAVDSGKRKEPEADGTGTVTPPPSTAIDFEKTCGIKIETTEGEDPDPIRFSETLKSLPIVVSGSQLGLTYRVTTSADLSIESRKKSGGKVDLQVSVVNVEVATNSPLLKIVGPIVAKNKAASSAKAASGPKRLEPLPNGQWLNLVTQEGQFKDLLCGITSAKSMVDTGGEKEARVEYAPALPNILNPLAPRETLEKEIGTGRTFSIVTKVTSTKENFPKVGEYPTTVSIKPKPPSFSTSDGKTYSSDLAYEIEVVVQEGDGKVPSVLSTKQVFYINLKSRNFDAIVDATQREMGGIKTPVIVLLRQ